MKFALTPILVAGLTFFSASAQVKGGAPEFDKLFDMFTMDEVEDCAWKAAKMVENDKYKKMPEPYLYYSMRMLQIWEKNEDLPEDEEPEFPKPYKDCFKYAAKARKKDKTGEICSQNEDFFDQLKEVGTKEAHQQCQHRASAKAACAAQPQQVIERDAEQEVEQELGRRELLDACEGEDLEE